MKKLLAKFAGEEIQEEVKEETTVSAEPLSSDTRTFWETYTPKNVYRELLSRISND